VKEKIVFLFSTGQKKQNGWRWLGKKLNKIFGVVILYRAKEKSRFFLL